jgi:hypothetical protein
LFFISCRNEQKIISIVTDDYTVIDIIDKFNSINDDFKIHFDYNKNLSESGIKLVENILKYKNSYDLMLFKYNSSTVGLKKYFADLKKYTTTLSKKKETYYNFFYNFLEYNDDIFILYSASFPVIIARKDSIKDNDYSNELDINSLSEYSVLSNIKEDNTRLNKIRLGFSPQLSYLNEIDYYFIFNSSIIKKNNKYSFITEESKQAYNFYNNFDKKFNYGNEIIKIYSERINSIDKNSYLDNKVLSFDLDQINNALCRSKDDYKIYLIKNMKYLGLSQKVGCIFKNSKNKHQAGKFLDYLLNSDSQKLLLDNSISITTLDKYINIPVSKKEVIKQNKLPITGDYLNSYMSNLNAINFYNDKTKKKFFDEFGKSKILLKKNTITENEFLEYFSNKLN